MRVLVPLKQGDEESEDYNNRKQKQKNGKSKRESPKEAASKQAPDTATNKAAKKRKLRDDTRHTGSALPAASASSTPGEDKGCTVIKEGNGDHHHPEQASNPSSSKDPPKLGGGAAVAVAVSFEDSAVATASTVTAAATAAASVAVTHDRHNNSNSNTESKERHEQEQEQENVVGGKKDQPNTASSPPSPPPTTANQEAPKSTLLQRNTDRKDRKAEATGETEIDIEPDPSRKSAAVNEPGEELASATLGSAASPNTCADTGTNSSVPSSTSSSKGRRQQESSRNTAESPRQQLRLPRQHNENDTPNSYDVGSHEIPAPAKLKLATHREHCATETGAATSATATATTTATANQASVAASFATEKPLKLPPPPVATTQTAAAASTTTTNQKETSQHGTDVTAERDRKRKALPKRTSESVRKASSICSLKDSPVVKRAKRKETGHSASHHRSNETATAIRAAPCGTSELTAKQLPTRSSTRLAPAHSSLSLPLPLPLTANQSSIPAAAATNTSKPAPSIALAAGSSTTRSAANRHHSKQSQHSYASNPETRKHTRRSEIEEAQKNKKKPPAAEAPQPINPGDLKPAARRSTRISKRSTSTLSITSNHNSGNINHSSSISNKNDNMGLYVRRPSSERDDDYRDMPEHDAPNTPSTRSSASSSASGSAHHRMDPYHHQHHPDSIIHHHAHDDPTTMTSTDARDHTVPNEDFVLELKKSGLEIREQDGDGNCLFRAISLQIYGDPSMHDDVRKQCLDFMERDQEHFAQFVTGEPFEEYVQRKRKDGVHGNNPEIQAISELFNRPVEVYCPENGAQPINIFHADYKTGDAPIRLSYHDGNHYNAVVDPLVPTAGLGLGLPDLQPGLADRMQVAKAVAESDKAADQEHLQKVMKKSEDDELQRAIKESSLSVEHMYNKQAMNLSDVDATYFEMEQAVLEQSLRDQGHTDASAAALASLKLQATDSKPAETKRSAISPAPTTHRHMMTRSSSVASGVAAASVAARTPIRPVSMIDGTAAVRLGNNNDMIGTSRNRDRNSRQPAMDAATVVTNGSGSGISSSASAAAMHPSAAAASVASMPSAASAMASSMDDASTSTSLMSMAADQEYPETVQELAMNGFPLQKVIKAYELLGDNFDELLVFLMSTTSETSATSGAASGATGSS
mmetsp:Transcript_18031/g.51225  ORF Transcript_18031/g.51225 Transcript_18031/m.51225 type:complete len:1156 (+) Transcript_18031:284-3751(+)